MEYITFIILILIILSIYKKGSKSYFDIPTVDEYLEQNPKCNTGYGIRCVRCGSKSIKNQGLINSNSYFRVHVCNHCGERLGTVQKSVSNR